MRGDGDGWQRSPDGTKHWGRFGAAGLLLRAPSPDGGSVVLLQHRAMWSHFGGTWALPGGAKDSHESSTQAALREAQEEAGIDPASVTVRAEKVTATAASGWTYTTVIGDLTTQAALTANFESRELRWVPEQLVSERKLHPGFSRSWPSLRAVPVVPADPQVVEGLGALPVTVELVGGQFGWLRESVELDGATGSDEILELVGGSGWVRRLS